AVPTKLFFYIQIDVQFLKLFLRHCRRCVHHQVACACRFRERDDVSDIICACKEHDETIETVGDAAMRRCTVCECFKEESELLVSFLIGEAECSEHSFLKFFIMYTYRTATEFVAVQYNIVCICPDFFRGGFQFV